MHPDFSELTVLVVATKSLEQDGDSCEVDEASVVGEELVVSGGDAAELLLLVEVVTLVTCAA